MTKSLAAAVTILAIIAGVVWFFTRPIEAPESATSVATSTISDLATTSTATKTKGTTPAAATKSGSAQTYKSLLTQKGSYECTFSQVRSSGQSSNVIYIYGGKLRGEFRSTDNGVTTANLVVYDGHYLYEWREGTSVGTRTVLTSLAQLPLVIPKDLTSGQIYGSNYESVGWDCHNWLTNKSLLTPPSYVTFK